MEYNQILEDAQKENAENERAIYHWRQKHDCLKLEEIEYVVASRPNQLLSKICS